VWYAAVQQHRPAAGRNSAGAIVVLAHVIDERRERQVTRREASTWCESVSLPYYETHPADVRGWKRMLQHIAEKCRPEAAASVLPFGGDRMGHSLMPPGLAAFQKVQ